MGVRSTRWVAAGVAVAVLVAGCGGGGDDEGANGGESGDGAGAGGEGSATTAPVDPELAAYCEAELAIETAPVPETDYETGTPEERAQGLRTYGSETMRPLADAVVAAAPEQLAADAQVLSAAVDELAASGDIAVFERPEVEEARDDLHAFDLDNCGWRTQQVTARESAFEGVPAELSPGPTSFELTNEGQELHELMLVRKKDGVTESVEELLALPQDQALDKLTLVGSALAAGGEADYLVTDLEPGEYVGACFVPIGTTGEDERPPQAMPHAGRGMVLELSVA